MKGAEGRYSITPGRAGPGPRAPALAAFALFALLLCPSVSEATPEHAEATGQGCLVCHEEASGGSLSPAGLEYAAGGYVWPPAGGYRVLGPIRKGARVAIGFLHMMASFAWFGTILYVHVLLRPGYALKGLPRGEVVLGLLSMAAVGVTGVLLTVSRINGLAVLYQTRWGVLLSVKILLYAFMVASALVAVTAIGPRLRRGVGAAKFPPDGRFGPQALSSFDGKEGRPSLVAVDGKVYDVSALRLWKDGEHIRHRAGVDLTSALSKAPHGPEKLARAKETGTFDPSEAPRLNTVQRLFYVIAYVNLALVFLTIFVISLWRWGV